MIFRIPSKTFLLGEYAILEGGPALLLGHGPHFQAQLDPGPANSPFHPASPAGQWLARHPAPGALRFTDPHGGRGGFGGSGAEFVAAFLATNPPSAPVDPYTFAWAAREAYGDHAGSGGDILVQAYGAGQSGDFFLAIDLPGRSLETLEPKLGLTLSLFSTGRKLATHEHLRQRHSLPTERLNSLTLAGLASARQHDGRAFGQALREYGQALRDSGLMAPHTEAALARLPEQVLGAKGCGAMGADVIAVLHNDADLTAWAQANSLAPVRSIPV